MKRRWAIVWSIVLGCSSTPQPSFKDIAYTIAAERVLLENGVAEREVAPGSASKMVTRYFGNEVEGDLDGDGIPDAAFLLTQEAGGSGSHGFEGVVQIGSQIESTRMVGLYEYMADAALFTDCATGLRVPVALGADHAALERRYLAARHEPGERMLVTAMGRIEARPRVEGEGMRAFLIVTRYEQVWPSESCEKSTVETPLENTYWRLVELDGAPVETHPDQPRDVHILLRPTETKLVGFAGCNDVMGRYELEAERLVFELPSFTVTECPHLSEETAFTGALARARRFLILGESLVLSSDAADVARFKAVYLH